MAVMTRIIVDVLTLSILSAYVFRARNRVARTWLYGAALSFLSPLFVYLVIISAGLRDPIHLDLAYDSLLVTFVARTRGRLESAVPGPSRQPPEALPTSPVSLGPISVVLGFLGYCLLAHLATGEWPWND